MKQSAFLIMSALLLFSCQSDDQGSDFEISIPVSVTEIVPGSIEEFITTTANVLATKNVILRSEIEGYYRLATNPRTGREYSPGDKVRTGETVIFLDNTEYENNIRVESQKLNLDISKREFEKQQSLYDKGGVTLRELKNAEINYINAQYAYDNAVIQLKKVRITAPFEGTVIDLPYYTRGVKIPANQIVVQIMDYSLLYADVYFPSKDLGRVVVGQALRVTHYNFPEDTLPGSIQQVAPALDPQTRAFKGSILVKNPKQVLRPGMFVQVETIVSRKDSVIVIPKEIILSKRDGKTVFIVDKGAAFQRTITTGAENEKQVEVLEGLKLKEQLVIKGFETLRNQSKVKIVR